MPPSDVLWPAIEILLFSNLLLGRIGISLGASLPPEISSALFDSFTLPSLASSSANSLPLDLAT